MRGNDVGCSKYCYFIDSVYRWVVRDPCIVVEVGMILAGFAILGMFGVGVLMVGVAMIAEAWLHKKELDMLGEREDNNSEV